MVHSDADPPIVHRSGIHRSNRLLQKVKIIVFQFWKATIFVQCSAKPGSVECHWIALRPAQARRVIRNSKRRLNLKRDKISNLRRRRRVNLRNLTQGINAVVRGVLILFDRAEFHLLPGNAINNAVRTGQLRKRVRLPPISDLFRHAFSQRAPQSPSFLMKASASSLLLAMTSK